MTGHLILGPLAAGPVTAFVAALMVTPILMVGLAITVEHRIPRPHEIYRAVMIGDPLLAIAVATGVATFPDGQVPAVWARGPLTPAVVAAWLLFGLAQWYQEVQSGSYTKTQALSPTKIWHQLGVLPILGTWLCVTALAPQRLLSHPWHAAVMAACLLGWIASYAYDSRHLRLGHAPFDWRHMRTYRYAAHSPSRTLAADARLRDQQGARRDRS